MQKIKELITIGIFAFGRDDKKAEKDFQSSAFFISRPPIKFDEVDALRVPVVKASVELITNSISQLPIYLYKEDIDRNIEKIQDDREFILNAEPNSFITAQELKKKLVQDMLFYGKAYAYRDKNGNLHHLPAKNISEECYTVDGITVAKKVYKYSGVTTVELDETQVIEISSGSNGLLCDSADLLNTAYSALMFQHNLLENSAIPTGVLKATSRLTDVAINRLRTSWESLYTGSKNVGKTVLLEEGLDYKQLSLNPSELQLNEVNKLLVAEICRVFNIPESMINSSANKYASNEQNNIQFLQNCLGPIINSIEATLNKSLLTFVEKKNGYYFRFDTSEILRTTELEKINALSTSFRQGLVSFNEARQKLDLPKTDKDYYILSIGNVLKYADGKLENLNMLTTTPNKGVNE